MAQPRSDFGHKTAELTCPSCKGTGKLEDGRGAFCGSCNGKGKVVDDKPHAGGVSVKDRLAALNKGGMSADKASVGQGNKCATCKQMVYHAEELKALGKFYHKECFKCAHCKARCYEGKYKEHGGEPYCDPCYASKFGIKLIGAGISTNESGNAHSAGGTAKAVLTWTADGVEMINVHNPDTPAVEGGPVTGEHLKICGDMELDMEEAIKEGLVKRTGKAKAVLYLPEFLNDKRVLSAKDGGKYLVDNSALGAGTEGLGYRNTKKLDDKTVEKGEGGALVARVAPWNSQLSGVMIGGWLTVEQD